MTDTLARQQIISLVAAGAVLAAILFGQAASWRRDMAENAKIAALEAKVDSSARIGREIRDLQISQQEGFARVIREMDQRSVRNQKLWGLIENRLSRDVERVAAKVETVQANIDTVQSVLPKPKNNKK